MYYYVKSTKTIYFYVINFLYNISKNKFNLKPITVLLFILENKLKIDKILGKMSKMYSGCMDPYY